MSDDLKEVFDYCPETGEIRWKISPAAHIAIGAVAGCLHHSGYWNIGYKGRKLAAHRVAWLLMTGSWPDGQIDHINLVKTDNRWANLRLATATLNNANSAARRDGMKGVTVHLNGRFQAQIKKDGRNYYLGLFGTEAEANAAYAGAAKVLFGDFARAA